MLSNFQLGDQALLQSFLVGQPELREMMQSPQMQQLRQRVIASYHLGPLDKARDARATSSIGCSSWAGRTIRTSIRRASSSSNADRRHSAAHQHPVQPAPACRIPGRAARASAPGRARDRARDSRGARRRLRARTAGGDQRRRRRRESHPRARAWTPPRCNAQFAQLEERIERLEKTVTAAVDLLHRGSCIPTARPSRAHRRGAECGHARAHRVRSSASSARGPTT